MITILHIARNTIRENLRETVFLLVLLSAIGLIGLFPCLSLFTFRQQVKMVVDSSMATCLVFGWMLAVVISTHALNREIEAGTALLMLSKPVSRAAFVIGKMLGILVSLIIFCFLCALAALVAVRVAKDQFRLDLALFSFYYVSIVIALVYGGIRNYMGNLSFPMHAVLGLLVIMPVTALVGQVVASSPSYQWQLVPAFALITCAVACLSFLAAALSTRLRLIINLTICALVFLLGIVSDHFFSEWAATSVIGKAVYAAIPNWQLFWVADALAANKPVPPSYVGLGMIYVALFMILFSTLGVILFQGREVNSQNV
jgi:ABC-type transport system involved in multi-copper enzyme maturation permease subunit